MEKRLKKLQIGKKIFLIACCIAIAQFACVKNMSTQPLTPTTSTIAQIIKQGTNLSILDSAMSRAGLLTTLDSTGSAAGAPFTLFAPVNLAFMNAGIYDSNIAKDSVAYLRRWMAYHIYAGNANTVADWSALVTYRNYPIQSASGDSFFLTIDSTGFYVNGNAVTQTDVIAKNGVIQALSGVLIPPYGNIYQTLVKLSTTSDTSLSFVVAAIQSAGSSQIQVGSVTLPPIDSLLSDCYCTFFAPTNAAFMASGDSSIAAIQRMQPDSLARLLLTHIIPGRIFSSDFPLDSVRFSLGVDSLFFSTILGNTITSVGDSTFSASVIQPNILTTNGLIHVVNGVLYPFYPF